MMEQTGLSQVPDWLQGLRGLTNLSLGSNALRELPDWIGALNQLEGLWLEQNRLRSLPQSLRNLPRLRVLRIDGNPDLHIPAHIAASIDPETILDMYFRNHSLPANI
jgi:Leucine-rich repeat (LRR) protein